MSINIATFYKMQFQLLKPLSPRQEYALVVLLVDELERQDLVCLAEVIVRDYPHTASLYDAFASHNEYENALPLIVPVLSSEEATQDIFCIEDHALVVSPTLRSMLEQALDRVESMKETQDELRFVVCREPMGINNVVDALLEAYNCGVMPIIVRPTKHQQKMRDDKLLTFELLREHNLFSGALDFTSALQPSEQARVLSQQLIGRLRNNTLAAAVAIQK